MNLTAGEKIKLLLKRQKMTQGELAEKLNQSRQNIAGKINRDNFSEKELREIAEAMNCSVEVVFTLNDTGESI